MITFPNAKINIGLNIVRKRDDGYHDIETIFYPVHLCDILEIVEKPVGSHMPLFYNTGLMVDSAVDKNLCVKAFRLLQNDFLVHEISIHLHKIIPYGAGLGGGSGNAAFTLSMLNKIFCLGLNEKLLKMYALKLGSDCAFFLKNKASLAKGRGDELKDINLSLAGWHIILVKPDIHISTAEAYSEVTPQIPTNNLAENIALPVENWKDVIFNDFEKHLLVKYKELLLIKEALYKLGAAYVSLSGSGSCMYGLFREKVDASSNFKKCFVWNGILS
jgi:4-diphosphocytidyl-2-C-methyl-D-erythritol kinase